MWSLTAGGRYSQDKIFASHIDLNRGPEPLTGSETFNDFSPRVVLKYQPDGDTTIFGSVSKGYKAGGVDVTGGSRTAPDKFDSEELISYEIGYKGFLLDNKLRLSGALFYLSWEDFQVQSSRLADPNDISSAISTTQNAEKASSRGFEMEAYARLTEQLSVSFNVGYNDAKFDDYANAVLKGEQNGLPNTVDVSGYTLPRTPEWSLSSTVDYTYDINGEWDGFVRLDWSYTGKTVSDIEAVASLVGETVNGDAFNLPTYPYQIPSYQVVNLSAGVQSGNIAIQAFVRNALDKQYYTGTADNFGLAGIRLKPHHREFGIKFTYTFEDY